MAFPSAGKKWKGLGKVILYSNHLWLLDQIKERDWPLHEPEQREQ